VAGFPVTGWPPFLGSPLGPRISWGIFESDIFGFTLRSSIGKICAGAVPSVPDASGWILEGAREEPQVAGIMLAAGRPAGGSGAGTGLLARGLWAGGGG